jgi:hypothetical protein
MNLKICPFLILALTFAALPVPSFASAGSLTCSVVASEVGDVLAEYGTELGDGAWKATGLGHSHGRLDCGQYGEFEHFNICSLMKFPKAAPEMMAVLSALDSLLGVYSGFGEDLLAKSYDEYLSLQAAGSGAAGRSQAKQNGYQYRFTAWPAMYDSPHEVCLNVDRI